MNAGDDGRQVDQTQARRLTWLRRAVAAVLFAGVIAFLVEGADQPPDPVLVPAGDEAQTRADESAAPVPPVRQRSDVESGSTTSTSPPPSTTSTLERPLASPTPPLASARPSSTAAPMPAPSASPSAPPVMVAPPASARRPLAGFDEVAFRIARADGRSFDGVALLADDQSSRRQGLMEQTDLRGYDAMVFRFDRPSEGGFYMRNTRILLSIAFFDGEGRFVSSQDMVPCPDDVRRCPSYFSQGPYLHAIEVAAGDLPRLGIGPGAVLSFPAR